MRRHSSIKAVLLGGVSVWLGATSVFAQATPQDASNGQLEEVVVTAQRREENQQVVPISITTFSGARLEQQNITQAQDLQANVPSLTVGPNGEGVRDTPTFTIRGQGSTFEGSPGVVVYLNEVPLPARISLSNQGGPGNFLDLSNLQVLEGPQGTLFGRNNTGGSVLLVPNKPTDSFEGYLQGTIGNYFDHELEGVINVPVVDDQLNIRLAVQTKDRDGFTHDVNWNVWRDDVHYVTGRFGVDWKPTAKFDNYTMVYGTNSENHGPGTINLAIDTPAIVATEAYWWTTTAGSGFQYGCSPSGPTSCANATAYYNGLAAQARALGPRADAPDVDEYDTIHTWGVDNTTRYEIAPETAVRNIASYAWYKGSYALDADGTPAPQYDVGVTQGPGAPFLSQAYPKDAFYTLTEEPQLQGNALDDNLTYTIGAFYFLQQTEGVNAGNAIEYCPYSLIVYNGCGYFSTTQIVRYRSRSEAAYAQGTYNLGQLASMLQDLKLTLGYRYTWDQIDGYSSFNINPAAPVPGFSGSRRENAPSWTAGLDYTVREGLLIYAKVSHGYKAGGINTYAVFTDTETFGPELDTTYELGWKSDSHIGDMPVRFNGDVYRTAYRKIQLSSSDYNPVTNVEGAVTIDSAEAVIQGVELQADAKPTRDLDVGLNYSYTDAYYTKFPLVNDVTFLGYTDCDGKPWNAGTVLNLKCRPLEYIAPNIASAHAQYTLPLDPSLGPISLFVNYSYEGGQHTEAFLGSQQPFELLKPYSLVNLSLNWDDINGYPLDASFFMTNVTNALYRTENSGTYEALARLIQR